jgi:hypothetical protein
VNWFAFWLKNEEDRDLAKADEYAGGASLRKLQELSDQKAASESVH